MGLMDRLLGKTPKDDGPPPEVRAVFDKIRHLLNDEVAQNRLYLPEMSAAIASGAAVDRLEDATGEFGRDPRNPIPVNGALGELIYISHLVTTGGSRLLGHRLGSVSNVDVYEVASIDGTSWDACSSISTTPEDPDSLLWGCSSSRILGFSRPTIGLTIFLKG